MAPSNNTENSLRSAHTKPQASVSEPPRVLRVLRDLTHTPSPAPAGLRLQYRAMRYHITTLTQAIASGGSTTATLASTARC
ncbi:MAG: hypothetical protein ACI4BC_08580 [Muribaculaceae bacterium]